MTIITSDMIIAEVLRLDKESAPIFNKHGMHCLGCPSASGESIADACSIHGIDTEKLIAELNEHFSK